MSDSLNFEVITFFQLFENFSDLADFTTIYIQEAHPTEENHFENFVDIDTHKYLPVTVTLTYSKDDCYCNTVEAAYSNHFGLGQKWEH